MPKGFGRPATPEDRKLMKEMNIADAWRKHNKAPIASGETREWLGKEMDTRLRDRLEKSQLHDTSRLKFFK